jgi:ribosomal protein L21E
MKIKKGDRVKIIKEDNKKWGIEPMFLNKTGIVLSIKNDCYEVDLENNPNCLYFNEKEIKKI